MLAIVRDASGDARYPGDRDLWPPSSSIERNDVFHHKLPGFALQKLHLDVVLGLEAFLVDLERVDASTMMLVGPFAKR